MEQRKALQAIPDQVIEQAIVAPSEELPKVEHGPIWAGWGYVFIALGILVELMSVGLFIFLIVIIPEIDLIAIFFLCIPFLTAAGGIFVIRSTRRLK